MICLPPLSFKASLDFANFYLVISCPAFSVATTVEASTEAQTFQSSGLVADGDDDFKQTTQISDMASLPIGLQFSVTLTQEWH